LGYSRREGSDREERKEEKGEGMYEGGKALGQIGK